MFGSVYWVSLILTNLNWNFLVPYCSESRDYFFLILAQHLLRETVTKNSVCESSFMSSFRIIRARWQCFDWQFNSQSRPRVLRLTSKMRTLGTRSFNSQYVTFAIRCVSTLSLLTPIILSFKFRFFLKIFLNGESCIVFHLSSETFVLFNFIFVINVPWWCKAFSECLMPIPLRDLL